MCVAELPWGARRTRRTKCAGRRRWRLAPEELLGIELIDAVELEVLALHESTVFGHVDLVGEDAVLLREWEFSADEGHAVERGTLSRRRDCTGAVIRRLTADFHQLIADFSEPLAIAGCESRALRRVIFGGRVGGGDGRRLVLADQLTALVEERSAVADRSCTLADHEVAIDIAERVRIDADRGVVILVVENLDGVTFAGFAIDDVRRAERVAVRVDREFARIALVVDDLAIDDLDLAVRELVGIRGVGRLGFDVLRRVGVTAETAGRDSDADETERNRQQNLSSTNVPHTLASPDKPVPNLGAGKRNISNGSRVFAIVIWHDRSKYPVSGVFFPPVWQNLPKPYAIA